MTKRGRDIEPKAIVRRVVGQVKEKSDTLHGTVLLEILLEESSCFHVNTHSTENDREVIFVTIVNVFSRSKLLDQASLTTNLGGNLWIEKKISSASIQIGILNGCLNIPRYVANQQQRK
jgi:hypothetical protein